VDFNYRIFHISFRAQVASPPFAECDNFMSQCVVFL